MGWGVCLRSRQEGTVFSLETLLEAVRFLSNPPMHPHRHLFPSTHPLGTRVRRSDLTAPAAVFNSAIWSYDPAPALQVLPVHMGLHHERLWQACGGGS